MPGCAAGEWRGGARDAEQTEWKSEVGNRAVSTAQFPNFRIPCRAAPAERSAGMDVHGRHVGRDLLPGLQMTRPSGVRAVWVVDPATQSVTVHEPGDAARHLGEDATLDGGPVLSGFELSVASLFVGQRRRSAERPARPDALQAAPRPVITARHALARGWPRRNRARGPCPLCPVPFTTAPCSPLPRPETASPGTSAAATARRRRRAPAHRRRRARRPSPPRPRR